MKRTMAVVAAAALVLTGCGGDPLKGGGGAAGGQIVIGSADFSESELLMHIYAGALTNAGVQVTTKPRVGSREVLVKALQDKSLAVVPEYSGNLLQYFDKQNPAAQPDEVVAALKQKVPGGLEVLEKAAAEDSDALVVSKDLANQGIRSIADLGPKCSQYVLGAAGEWKDRWPAKIAQLYGCTFKEIKTTDAAGPVTVEALKSGQVQVANLFTTASAISANGFVALEDPKRLYPAQNILPLIRSEALDAKGKAALNKVSAALTTDKLVALNKRIEIDKETVADVAKEFVTQNKL
ncbi:ABC transporter substrate-binding protein [Allokutzneria sp. A3M-2-11 16]|uniref:ABC transporter substrate-binding protein n=1 Tax=Allokutzneria sp. A3M-2-11 16 TaxID=2962043 RepID=UPI0020B7D570|nr:ABC transporter substrate-binding protein [Allokutzneria sp. A3M-2-11 16]MCP3800573.1 ABC transporter substrate-binding protein [Allokutzneria sp. A3M-2-11 16]